MTSSGNDLSVGLENALTLLPDALQEEFTGHPMQGLVTQELPQFLSSVIEDDGYLIKGSRGAGRWAETVWVSIFDRLVTESAQHGYYIVYLFRNDGKAVYLSLNQGTTAVHEEAGRDYLKVLRERAALFRGLLVTKEVGDLLSGPIDLAGRGSLTRGYEAGNVAALRYDRNSFPEGEHVRADLLKFIGLYQQLVAKADAIYADSTSAEGDQKADPENGIEGRRVRWHRRVERNAKLAQAAKKFHGTKCMACEFDFGEFYGELGAGYIEAHHLIPLSELNGRPTELNPETDFTVLCANCHRMVHQHVPPLSVEEVKASLQAEGKQ
jgi:5-methylcytosine-specific restriction protein A